MADIGQPNRFPLGIRGNGIQNKVDQLVIEHSALRSPREHPPILLYGPSGVGKTCLAHYLAERFAPSQFPVHILPDDPVPLPEALARAGDRVVVIDDAHLLSGQTQTALVRYLRGQRTAGQPVIICARETIRDGKEDVSRLWPEVPLVLFDVQSPDITTDLRRCFVERDSVYIPAIRVRQADLLALAALFFERSIRQTGFRGGISSEVPILLLEHRWRDNVRELEQTIARAVQAAVPSENVFGEHFEGIMQYDRDLAGIDRTSFDELISHEGIQFGLGQHQRAVERAVPLWYWDHLVLKPDKSLAEWQNDAIMGFTRWATSPAALLYCNAAFWMYQHELYNGPLDVPELEALVYSEPFVSVRQLLEGASECDVTSNASFGKLPVLCQSSSEDAAELLKAWLPRAHRRTAPEDARTTRSKLADVAEWAQLRIQIKTDYHFEVQGREGPPIEYSFTAVTAFHNRASGAKMTSTVLWDTFKTIAVAKGILPYADLESDMREKLRKRIDRLNDALQLGFGLDQQPIVREGNNYSCRFRIVDVRGGGPGIIRNQREIDEDLELQALIDEHVNDDKGHHGHAKGSPGELSGDRANRWM